MGAWGHGVAIALALAAVLCADGAAFAGDGATCGAPGRGLLLIGTASSANVKDDRRALVERIHARVLTGARVGGRENSSFGDVVAFDEFVRRWKQLGPEVADFSRYAGLDMKAASTAIQRLPAPRKAQAQVAGYVQSTISELDGDLRIDLQLYCRGTGTAADDWRLAAVKTVGGAGNREDEVLDLVVDAARRLVDTSVNESPQAVIDARPGQEVPLGATVTLDGSGSADPDHDALVLRWKQEPVEGLPTFLPETGVMRKKIEFTPRTEGRYTFLLLVEEVIHRGSPADARRAIAGSGAAAAAGGPNVARITVEVLRAPLPVAGDSRQIDQDLTRPTIEKLEGSCASCTRARWRQVAGPQLTLTGPCEETAQGATTHLLRPSCSFVPSVPGEYTFELLGANALGEKTARVTYLVAPRPFAIAGPRQIAAQVGVPLRLDASASYDSLDPEPLFQWEARETRFPDLGGSCFPSGDYRHGAMVLTPTGRTAWFLARERKTYQVRLLVRARRYFAGRQMWSYECATMEVKVVPRPWTVFLGGGSQISRVTGERTASDSYLAGWAGANVLLSGGWGVRLTQALYSYQLNSGKGTGGFGGSTLAGSYTFDRDAWLVRAHLGLYVRLTNGNRLGPTTGVDVAFPLRDVWELLVGTHVNLIWDVDQTLNRQFNLVGWTGVGRMF